MQEHRWQSREPRRSSGNTSNGALASSSPRDFERSHPRSRTSTRIHEAAGKNDFSPFVERQTTSERQGWQRAPSKRLTENNTSATSTHPRTRSVARIVKCAGRRSRSQKGEERFVCDRTNDSSPASLRGTSWVFICTTVAVVDRNIRVRALQTARSSCELRPLSLTTRRAEGLRRKGVESSMRGRSLCDALAMVCTIPKGVDSASAKRSKTTSVRAATHVKACEFRTSKGVRNAVSPLLGEHVVVRNACELRLMG